MKVKAHAALQRHAQAPSIPTGTRMKTKDIDELVARLDAMGLDTPVTDDEDTDRTLDEPSSAPSRAKQPFPFLALPYELRLRIYELLLVSPKTLDLDPSNSRTLIPSLRLFFVSRQIHAEASRIFYSLNTFRIFPIHGRFFHTKYALLSRLSPTYRGHITKLELRLGPGWTKPPKGWVIDERLNNRRRLRLVEVKRVHMLKVFVECDPASSDIFNGFRHKQGDEFYTRFCVELIQGLFTHLPTIDKVEFDAYPSVKKTSPLLRGLVGEVEGRGLTVLWGPERDWEKVVDVDLVGVLAKMGIDGL
ncbi:hypothetical protein CC80DRAFT_493350 [Byssothecium circinans]|uniref:F-box domain-containing protein n=1 Tax=Byssothecium circinans TaxID=147558 RepID=A0A6A5TTG3_9PLEO|nr:hypothetical protein CC80DRAFT_493350 [Byssothecium circinans]